MGRSEANALQPIDGVDRFQQLDESRLTIPGRNLTFAVTGDDLSEQSDFLDPARHQLTAFRDDILDGTAALLTARVRDDAKRAVLIAALHDANKGGDGLMPVSEVFFDGGLTAR